MLNGLWNWIDLHEGQLHKELSEGDSFHDNMETSTLHGEYDDSEVYAWEHKCPQPVTPSSLPDYWVRMESTRYRMKRLLAAVELTPQSENPSFLLPTLRATCGEFRSLLESPYAWQDIHAADSELILRAEAALRKANML